MADDHPGHYRAQMLEAFAKHDERPHLSFALPVIGRSRRTRRVFPHCCQERIGESAVEYLVSGRRAGMFLPDASNGELENIRVVA